MSEEQKAREFLARFMMPSNSYDYADDSHRILRGVDDCRCFLCPRDVIAAMVAYAKEKGDE